MGRKVDQSPGTEVAKTISFAKRYVALVEALLREGLTEDQARTEARLAAMMLLREDDQPRYDPAAGPCPTCQRG